MRLNYKLLIGFLSILVPGLVAIIYLMPKLSLLDNKQIYLLPKLNAIINASTAVSLLLGFFAIKNNKKTLHRALMLFAFLLSSLFLVSYVIYHSSSEPTLYGGDGIFKIIYLSILISHILLAALILPLILLVFYRALSGDFIKHKKMAKWVFPLWLYVAITGVVIYLMLSPYY